jgi:peptidyl-prolyl cis-trans isomerase B (cyclophilin B)
VLKRLALPAATAALLPLLAACGGGASSTTGQNSAQSPGRSGSASTASCTYADAPQGATRHVDKPPSTPDVQGMVDVSIKTSIGTLGATLDADQTPFTVNSFVSLA